MDEKNRSTCMRPIGWSAVLEAITEGSAVEICDGLRPLLEILPQPPRGPGAPYTWLVTDVAVRNEDERSTAEDAALAAVRRLDVVTLNRRIRRDDLRAYRLDDLGAQYGRRRLMLRRIPFGVDDTPEGREEYARNRNSSGGGYYVHLVAAPASMDAAALRARGTP